MHDQNSSFSPCVKIETLLKKNHPHAAIPFMFPMNVFNALLQPLHSKPNGPLPESTGITGANWAAIMSDPEVRQDLDPLVC